jgi:hypothetical protein
MNDDKLYIKYSKILPIVLEAVIDSRFKYLKELEYENHSHARQILEQEYKPAVEKLEQILEIIA